MSIENQQERVKKVSLREGGYTTKQLINELKRRKLTNEELSELVNMVEPKLQKRFRTAANGINGKLYTSEGDKNETS